MKKPFIAIVLFTLVVSSTVFGLTTWGVAGPTNSSASPQIPARIELTVDGKKLTATLADSEAAKDFLSLLPLTLTLEDLFGREKFAHLPRSLSEEGKRSRKYEVGTIAYWPPGQDVVIFYRHGGPEIPEPGIILLGTIDSGVEALKDLTRPAKITIKPY